MEQKQLIDFLESILEENEKIVLYSRIGAYGKPKTLEEVGYILGGVTRERARQLQERAIKKIRDGYDHGVIDDTLLQTAINSAINGLPVGCIEYPIAPELGSEAYTRLIALVFSDKMRILKSNLTRTPVLIQSDYELESQISKLLAFLSKTDQLINPSDIASKYGFSECLIREISGLVIVDGKIALKTNRKIFYKNSSTGIVEHILEETGRPMKTNEIARLTGLKVTQVRGAVERIPGVVNVGLSLYALKKWGYLEGDTADIAYYYLKEAQKPMRYRQLESIVLKQRYVNKSSVQMALQIDERFQQLSNRMWVLKEWGYEDIKVKRALKRYAISARKALLSVLGSTTTPVTTRSLVNQIITKYGKDATHTLGTYLLLLKRLEAEGIVEKLYFGRNVLFVLRDK